MGYKGTVKGKVIELDEPLPYPDGTRVEVTVQPEVQPEKKPRKNSPQALLQLAGTLTEEEAEAIMKVVREHVRKIDWEMWGQDEP
ncbi:MAG: hypothetical protein LM632_11195 [Armatimonadetes bacterium]|jgi:hypothetical protein|nr:hypothetical protein [Armatimonadota bacterium]